MSAIAGIFHMNGEPISIEHSNGMMKSLEKYPADDVQTWHNGHVFFGCHAQWITPESVGEKLPYYDHNRKLAITADAIIDNRDELFDKLNIKKDKRAQMTDSELILLSYEKWGEESPKHLVGDFAYMIWDEREQKLFGARDFAGRRTLYYYNDDNYFAFCTTIHPILAMPSIEKKINDNWIAEFLVIPDMYEVADVFSTVYKEVRQIPPSYSLSIRDNKINMKRYINVSEIEHLKLKSNEEYIEAFKEVFQKAVHSRLRTFKNVGAHLSGGLDSGSVVSFAARELKNQKKKLQTLSYIPEENFNDWTPKYRIADERPFINATVQHVGNIENHYLDFAGKSPYTVIDDFLDTLEMPYKFFENSFWLKGFFEEAQNLGIGILLNGKMGNYTISWGPALEYYAELIKKLKLVQLYQELNLYSVNVGVGKKRIVSLLSKKAFPFLKLNSHKQSILNIFPEVINKKLIENTNVYEKLQKSYIDITGTSLSNTVEVRKSRFNRLFYLNIGAANGTKLSLCHSLWERDPTNDLRVVQFCLSVPFDQYVDAGMDRALIRRATVKYLPDKVRLNQRVRGIQGSDGIHRMMGTWQVFLEELEVMIRDSIMFEYFDMKVLKDLVSELGELPNPEIVFEPYFKMLMRSLIVYKFLKRFA
jgi:asparagine synthase (glutamine-hydrolysing)